MFLIFKNNSKDPKKTMITFYLTVSIIFLKHDLNKNYDDKNILKIFSVFLNVK